MLLFVLLAVLASGTYTRQGGYCSTTWGSSLPSHAGGWNSIETYGSCRASCDADPACMAFTFHLTNGGDKLSPEDSNIGLCTLCPDQATGTEYPSQPENNYARDDYQTWLKPVGFESFDAMTGFWHQSFTAQDWAGAASVYTEDGVLQVGADSFTGHEEIAAFFENLYAMSPTASWEVTAMSDAVATGVYTFEFGLFDFTIHMNEHYQITSEVVMPMVLCEVEDALNYNLGSEGFDDCDFGDACPYFETHTIIDVRAADAYEASNLGCALNYPRLEIADNVDMILAELGSHDAPIAVHCYAGGWAAEAKDILEGAGFSNVVNIGGYDDIVSQGCTCPTVESDYVVSDTNVCPAGMQMALFEDCQTAAEELGLHFWGSSPAAPEGCWQLTNPANGAVHVMANNSPGTDVDLSIVKPICEPIPTDYMAGDGDECPDGYDLVDTVACATAAAELGINFWGSHPAAPAGCWKLTNPVNGAEFVAANNNPGTAIEMDIVDPICMPSPQLTDEELIAQMCQCVEAHAVCDGTCTDLLAQHANLSPECQDYAVEGICGGLVPFDMPYYDICPNECRVDCVGDFGEWGECSVACEGAGTRERTFMITTDRAGSGSSCMHSDGEVESEGCDNTMVVCAEGCMLVNSLNYNPDLAGEDIPTYCRDDGDDTGVDMECVKFSCMMVDEDSLCPLIADDSYTIIDVRAATEWDTEHLDCAHNFPRPELDNSLDDIAAVMEMGFDTPILVYCTTGYWAEQALGVLKDAGYTDVTNIGGYVRIKDEGCACSHACHCDDVADLQNQIEVLRAENERLMQQSSDSEYINVLRSTGRLPTESTMSEPAAPVDGNPGGWWFEPSTAFTTDAVFSVDDNGEIIASVNGEAFPTCVAYGEPDTACTNPDLVCPMAATNPDHFGWAGNQRAFLEAASLRNNWVHPDCARLRCEPVFNPWWQGQLMDAGVTPSQIENLCARMVNDGEYTVYYVNSAGLENTCVAFGTIQDNGCSSRNHLCSAVDAHGSFKVGWPGQIARAIKQAMDNTYIHPQCPLNICYMTPP